MTHYLIRKLYKKRITNKLPIMFLLFIMIMTTMLPIQIFATDNKMEIVFFYNNPCGACEPEEEFYELFDELIGEASDDVAMKFTLYNTFHSNGSEMLEKYIKKYSVPKDSLHTDILFLEGVYFIGEDAIREDLKEAFLKIKDDYLKDIEIIESKVQYFYVSGCKDCEKVDDFIKKIPSVFELYTEQEDKQTKLNFIKHNIGESENLELIRQYFKEYNVTESEQSVPIAFIGNTYLAGEENIRENLVTLLQNGTGLNNIKQINSSSNGITLSGYSFLGILSTGLLNGLNPCSISMLLFFLSLLITSNVKILRAGISFILGKLIAYFVLGTVLYNVFLRIDMDWFSIVSKIVMSILVVIIVTLNVSDFIAAKRENYDKIKLQLPVGIRKKLHALIKKVSKIEDTRTVPVLSFSLGILVSGGEFLCTGQIYLAAIIYVMKNTQVFNLQAILYFLIYCVAFVLPLFIIVILINKGKEVFFVSETIREKMHIIKLINAIVFALFGIVIILFF